MFSKKKLRKGCRHLCILINYACYRFGTARYANVEFIFNDIEPCTNRASVQVNGERWREQNTWMEFIVRLYASELYGQAAELAFVLSGFDI